MMHHVVDQADSAAGNPLNPTAPRSDLPEMVTNALASAGHPNPSAWQERLPAAYDAAPDVGHQIFLINRAWRLMLGELQNRESDTSDARYCLVDTPMVNDWMRAFTQGVVPCAVKHNLPLPRTN